MTSSIAWRAGMIVLVVLAVAIMIITAPNAPFALQDWNMETRLGLPLHMKIWLGFMLVANLSSVLFVRRHIAARFVLGAWVASHVWIGAIEGSGLFSPTGGFVSFGHLVFWAPAIWALYAYRSEIKLPSAYGVWACYISFVYAVSLVFDSRDSVIWIASLVR
ncbi:MAG: hypothetical protein AAF559_05650 [Pseudomonadota bacterium]